MGTRRMVQAESSKIREAETVSVSSVSPRGYTMSGRMPPEGEVMISPALLNRPFIYELVQYKRNLATETGAVCIECRSAVLASSPHASLNRLLSKIDLTSSFHTLLDAFAASLYISSTL